LEELPLEEIGEVASVGDVIPDDLSAN